MLAEPRSPSRARRPSAVRFVLDQGICVCHLRARGTGASPWRPAGVGVSIPMTRHDRCQLRHPEGAPGPNTGQLCEPQSIHTPSVRAVSISTASTSMTSAETHFLPTPFGPSLHARRGAPHRLLPARPPADTGAPGSGDHLLPLLLGLRRDVARRGHRPRARGTRRGSRPAAHRRTASWPSASPGHDDPQHDRLGRLRRPRLRGAAHELGRHQRVDHPGRLCPPHRNGGPPDVARVVAPHHETGGLPHRLLHVGGSRRLAGDVKAQRLTRSRWHTGGGPSAPA